MLNYNVFETPSHYFCSKCQISNVKLWRQYNTFLDQIELLCLDCAKKDQEKEFDWKNGDQIGSLIPAVPTEDCETYWGYCSVPSDGCRWWYNLEPKSNCNRHDQYFVSEEEWQKRISE